MKKLNILVSLILMGVSSVLFSQAGKFRMEVVGGSGFSTLWGDEVLKKNADFKIGYTGGILAEYYFAPQFSVQTGVHYENKGAIINFETYDFDGNPMGMDYVRFSQNYMLFPIQARLYFGKRVKFFCESGFYFGSLLNAKSKWKGSDIDAESEVDITSYYKQLDVGIIGGVGLSYLIRDEFSLSLELKDNLGLYDISSVPVKDDGRIRTHSIMLLLGVGYYIGGKS